MLISNILDLFHNFDLQIYNIYHEYTTFAR